LRVVTHQLSIFAVSLLNAKFIVQMTQATCQDASFSVPRTFIWFINIV